MGLARVQAPEGNFATSQTTCQARPRPILGPPRQSGTQRIAFHVTKYPQEVIVLGDRKCFETIPAHVTAARTVMVLMPAYRMRQSQPAQKRSQLPIGGGPKGAFARSHRQLHGKSREGERCPIGMKKNLTEGLGRAVFKALDFWPFGPKSAFCTKWRFLFSCPGKDLQISQFSISRENRPGAIYATFGPVMKKDSCG
jgi:hypothetical protein